VAVDGGVLDHRAEPRPAQFAHRGRISDRAGSRGSALTLLRRWFTATEEAQPGRLSRFSAGWESDVRGPAGVRTRSSGRLCRCSYAVTYGPPLTCGNIPTGDA